MSPSRRGLFRRLVQTADPIQRVAKIVFIRLRNNVVENNLELGESAQVQIKYSLQIKCGYKRGSTRFIARVTVNSAGYRRDPGKENQIAFRCVPEFEILYEVPKGTKLTERQVRAFSEIHSPRDAWPYIRDAIQSATVWMGFPPFILPEYRPEQFWQSMPVKTEKRVHAKTPPAR